MGNEDIKKEMRKMGVKRLIDSKQKKALWAIVIIATAGIISAFVIVEYIRVQNRIILATTTSTYDSGLLDYLLPVWEEKAGVTVEVLSVGTGEAITAGESGNADVLLVHSRTKEDLFIDEGYGLYRTCVMYNDFIIIGPSNDANLANVSGASSITEAMTRLKVAGEAFTINFTSRGDDSGTHNKELALWKLVSGFVPNSAVDLWYSETGEGMGSTLTIANQLGAYTIIDRGTWLFLKDTVSLVLLYEGDEILLNPYGAIVVNPLLHSGIKYEKAIEFVAFLVSEEGQDLIRDYKVNNQILFIPCFGKCNETHSCKTTAAEVAFWSQYNGGHIRTTSEGCTTISSEVTFWNQCNGGHIRTTLEEITPLASYSLYGTISRSII